MRIIAIVLTSLLLVGCAFLKKKEPAKLQVVNVLDRDLFDDCHIKGSVNVPFEQLESFAKGLDKDTPIVLYCSNYKCTASGLGARMLKDVAFKDVWAYEAGLAEWYQLGLPVNGPCKEAYLKMENKPIDSFDTSVKIISTDELQKKMGLVK